MCSYPVILTISLNTSESPSDKAVESPVMKTEYVLGYHKAGLSIQKGILIIDLAFFSLLPPTSIIENVGKLSNNLLLSSLNAVWEKWMGLEIDLLGLLFYSNLL